MKIYVHPFELLKENMLLFSTLDGMDSVIDSRDILSLLHLYFEVKSVANDIVHSYWWNNIMQLFSYDNSCNDMLICDRLIASDVCCYSVSDWAAYQGYYLVLFTLSTEYNNRRGKYLGVMSMSDNHFVGAISSTFGGVHTAELSRLILTTPDILWEV